MAELRDVTRKGLAATEERASMSAAQQGSSGLETHGGGLPSGAAVKQQSIAWQPH